MSENTSILALPLIQANQAQKHVTHNEAIRRLDALVQPVAADLDRTEPPASPASGDRHIVAAGATGDWMGRDGNIAVREDAAWTFIRPERGWRIHVADAGQDAVFDGSRWRLAATSDRVDRLGIGTGADDTNRLAVSADATLLTHAGGGHQLKLDKADETETNSLLFQTGWSGRAEMGCVGEDGFSIKVSPDGTTWHSAMRVEPTTGAVTFPSGLRTLRQRMFGSRFTCQSDGRWVTYSNTYGIEAENANGNAGTGAEPNEDWRRIGVPVRAGTTMTGLHLLLRGSDAVPQIDMRVIFQCGPATGSWDSNGATELTVLAASDGLALGSRWATNYLSFAQFEAPRDGFLLPYLRPTAAPSGTAHVYTAMTLDVLA